MKTWLVLAPAVLPGSTQIVGMAVLGKVQAQSPEAALHIAKSMGYRYPIVGEEQERAPKRQTRHGTGFLRTGLHLNQGHQP